MAGDKSAGTQLEQWVSLGATIAVPVTVLGALLFYFGYVSSASEYAYFGINVDTIGLSTQAYIMRSPQILLVPLLVLTLGSAGFLTLNAAVRKGITLAVSCDDPAWQIRRIQFLAQRSRIPGLAVLVIGILLLFLYSYIRDWAFYGPVTPLLIGFGAAMIAYASRVLNLVQHAREEPGRAAGKARGPDRPTAVYADGQVVARRTVGVLICVVIAASVFWATATIAQWSGRGLAQYAAMHFGSLPSVILDSRERLFLRGPGVKESQLPPDGSVRVQFQFQNQPP